MKYFSLLLVIFILACILRFYHLNGTPAFNADEAALGYNAYSLLTTGKDEHGNSWPIHFQSFNDYKPGLYVYLVMPFIKFFDLNEIAVRFPGALLGSLTPIVLFFLVKQLTKSNRQALLAALLLAINPWHIHFSRGAWEVNVATFFMTCGVLFFLKARKNSKYWLASALFFVASLYTYHAARVVVPLLVVVLTLFFVKPIKKQVQPVVIASVIGILLLIPLIISLFGPAGISRASGVGLTADIGPASRAMEQRGEHQDYTSSDVKLLHNKGTNYMLAFLSNWVEHYHGEFLFLSGDEIQRNKVPETGQLYLIEVVFVILGIWFALKKRGNYLLILIWLLISPIAAALTFQSPHALRAHNMIIPLTILSAIGVSRTINFLQVTLNHKRLLKTSYVLIATVFVLSLARYLHMYYIHMAKEYPFSSQYGVKELIQYIKTKDDQYQKIYITDRYDQPYILFLFYLKYPPQDFQRDHSLTERDVFGFSTVRSFDKYNFISINDWKDRQDTKNTMLAGTPEEIGSSEEVVYDEIHGTNGFLYFKITTPK